MTKKVDTETIFMQTYIPIEITEKMVDIYNYMAVFHNDVMRIRFEDGIQVECKIDVSEYKHKIDFSKVILTEGVNE